MTNLFKIGSKLLQDTFNEYGSEIVAFFSSDGVLIPALTQATVCMISEDNSSMPMEGYPVEDRRIDFTVDASAVSGLDIKDGWYFMYNHDQTGAPADGVEYTCFSFAGKPITTDSDEFGNRVRIHTRKYRD